MNSFGGKRSRRKNSRKARRPRKPSNSSDYSNDSDELMKLIAKTNRGLLGLPGFHKYANGPATGSTLLHYALKAIPQIPHPGNNGKIDTVHFGTEEAKIYHAAMRQMGPAASHLPAYPGAAPAHAYPGAVPAHAYPGAAVHPGAAPAHAYPGMAAVGDEFTADEVATSMAGLTSKIDQLKKQIEKGNHDAKEKDELIAKEQEKALQLEQQEKEMIRLEEEATKKSIRAKELEEQRKIIEKEIRKQTEEQNQQYAKEAAAQKAIEEAAAQKAIEEAAAQKAIEEAAAQPQKINHNNVNEYISSIKAALNDETKGFINRSDVENSELSSEEKEKVIKLLNFFEQLAAFVDSTDPNNKAAIDGIIAVNGYTDTIRTAMVHQ